MDAKEISAPLLDAMRAIDESLRAVSPERQFCTLYGFVARHATIFGHAGRKPKGVRMGPIKECYANATKLWMQNWLGETRWRYVEGYVCRPEVLIPIHHAWVVDPDGVIVDTTLRDGRTAIYAGVVIQDGDVRATIARTGYYGVLDTGVGYNMPLIAKMDAQFLTEGARAQARDYLAFCEHRASKEF